MEGARLAGWPSGRINGFGRMGLPGCLWASVAFAAASAVVALMLPRGGATTVLADVEAEPGGD